MSGYKGPPLYHYACACGQGIKSTDPLTNPRCWRCIHPPEKSRAWYRKHHAPVGRRPDDDPPTSGEGEIE